jgi:hypothetical protein
LHGVIRAGEVTGYGNNQRRFAFSVVCNKDNNPGAELFLSLVSEASQVLGIDAAQRLSHDFDAFNAFHAIVASRRCGAATHRKFLFRVRKLAFETLALVEQRHDTVGHVLDRHTQFGRSRLG